MSPQDDLELAFRAFARGDYGRAAEHARKTLRASPDDPGALTLFGRLALVSQEPEVARQIFDRLLQGPQRPAATWLDLSQALLDLRRDRDALSAAEEALALEPRSVPALLRIGSIRHSLGEHAGAAEGFRQALALDDACVAAYRGLCEAEAVAPTSETAQRMRALAEAPATTARQSAELHYALAQICRRAGDDDSFVRHLLTANERQRSQGADQRPQDVDRGSALADGREQYEQAFARLDAAFTAEAFGAVPRAAEIAPTPIFILGMPRSGTTLVEQLIAAHPDVRAAGELDYMRGPLRQSLERFTGRPFPAGFESLAPEALNGLARMYARRIAPIAAGARFVTDKTPGNYHLLGLLRVLFPAARIVHVERDPMDTCFSILQYPFDDRSPHTCDVALLAYSYGRYVRLMRRWRELFPGEFVSVRYEELVQNPRDEARRVFEFCGLQWRDEFLEARRAGAAVRTFSASQVSRPIYQSSVGASRRHAGALEPLRAALDRELAEESS